MPGRWVRVFSALALVLACAAQPLPAVIDTHKVDPAVRITAEQKAKELCGWGAEAIAHVQEDVAKNATSAPARRLLELGKGSPKVVKGAKPAATPAVTTDPAELARILCAELDVAKKLDAVGECCEQRPKALTEQHVTLSLAPLTGDRLELELEATLELEESQEAKRAKAKQREEVAAEKLSKEETALGILLIVGACLPLAAGSDAIQEWHSRILDGSC